MQIHFRKRRRGHKATTILNKKDAVVFCDFRNIDANKMSGLRAEAKNNELKIGVLPNCLIETAINNYSTKIHSDKKRVRGQMMFVSGKEIFMILSFLQNSGIKKLRLGFETTNSFLNQNDILKISAVPSKTFLIGWVIEGISFPIQTVISILDSIKTIKNSNTNNPTTNFQPKCEKMTSSVSKEEIIKCIENMTALELYNLSQALKERFGVADKTILTNHFNTEKDNNNNEQLSKENYNLNLIGVGSNKIAVIKTIKEITGLSLKEAKIITEKVPTTLKEGITKEKAEELQTKLKSVGAEVQIK
ncbi:50S ribosomal subunit proteins L7/L12 and L10 [Candidatus Tremblaya phenacola PAVE]|nr:50S ribosomal subunit proteins L7/L12 and L10 [Candidatus Tremblaya phenacola PAVE]